MHSLRFGNGTAILVAAIGFGCGTAGNATPAPALDAPDGSVRDAGAGRDAVDASASASNDTFFAKCALPVDDQPQNYYWRADFYATVEPYFDPKYVDAGRQISVEMQAMRVTRPSP